jgi:hypothetical protein
MTPTRDTTSLAALLTLAAALAGCAAPGNPGSWTYPVDAPAMTVLRSLDAAGALESAGSGTRPVLRR